MKTIATADVEKKVAARKNKLEHLNKELLTLIYEEGEAYPGFFTDELDIESNQINEMLKTLCQEGYITCETYTTPARKVKYINPIITHKGKTFLEK
jgi:DNA-binding PadR family transcriptional regulator